MQPRTAGALTIVALLGLGLFAASSGRARRPTPAKPAATAPSSIVQTVAVRDIAPPAPVAAPTEMGAALAALIGGGEVPALPGSAPKQVTFGVVLFAYAGAQGAPQGAPSKQAALERAQSVLPKAVSDFAEASKHGDSGSVANAGRISRGILEPALEYALFTLPKGQVFPEPIDTPRGYWLLRRID